MESELRHMGDIKNGVRDIAAGAFKNPERAEYAYFSAPYRKETDVLYVRKGDASRYLFKDVLDLTRQSKLGPIETQPSVCPHPLWLWGPLLAVSSFLDT
jgi:hypothetical protein